MTSRMKKLLAAFAAAAFVVPTAFAQQPTNLQLYNINAGAVGGRWLLQPGTATSGLYIIQFPNISGTLVASPTPLTANRLMATDGSGNATTFDLGTGGIVYGTANQPTLLAAGTADFVLRMNGTGTAPVWSAGSDFAWILGGNASPSNNDLGTTSATALDIVTTGTPRISIAAAGAITANNAITLNTAGAADLTIDETTLSRAGSIAINPGAANTLSTDGSVTIGVDLTVTGTTNLNGASNIGNGGDNVNINAGTGSFQLSSTGLSVSATGDISDAGGAVVVNDPQGLNVQAGGIDVDAGTSNIDGTVNINNVAAGNTTTIGNNTVGNTVSIPAPTVNMANLPAGAATDNLITTDGTALRETAISTLFGANQGLQYTSGTVLLGHGTDGSNPITSNRFVSVNTGNALTFNNGAGTNSLVVDGTSGNVGMGAGASTTNQATIVNDLTGATSVGVRSSVTSVNAANANIGTISNARSAAGNIGVFGAALASDAQITSVIANTVGGSGSAGVLGYSSGSAANQYGVAALADQASGVAIGAFGVGTNSIGVRVLANNTGGVGVYVDAAATGVQVITAPVSFDGTGDLLIDGSSTLGDADADITTIRGSVNLNTTNTGAASVSINSTAFANTTTIGSNTAGNTINLDAPVINAGNLPAGAASDALITTNGTALRETSVATMLGNTAWLVGGNTITGSATTLNLGVAAQAGSEDALAIQTDGTARLTFGGTGGITAATTLDMGNNAISNIGAAGTDFSGTGGLTLADVLTISPTSNQIVLGTTNTTTVNAIAPAVSRAYTMPDVGADADFVMTEGTQTVNGAKTHLGNIAINSSSTGTTDIGTGANSGAVTIGNTGNSTTFGSEVALGSVNQAGIGGAGAIAAFTKSYERVTVTEAAAAYNITMPAGVDGQVVYLRIFFDENAGGPNGVTLQGVGGAPNFFTWAGTADETYLVHAIYDNAAGEWQIINTTQQP